MCLFRGSGYRRVTTRPPSLLWPWLWPRFPAHLSLSSAGDRALARGGGRSGRRHLRPCSEEGGLLSGVGATGAESPSGRHSPDCPPHPARDTSFGPSGKQESRSCVGDSLHGCPRRLSEPHYRSSNVCPAPALLQWGAQCQTPVPGGHSGWDAGSGEGRVRWGEGGHMGHFCTLTSTSQAT